MAQIPETASQRIFRQMEEAKRLHDFANGPSAASKAIADAISAQRMVQNALGLSSTGAVAEIQRQQNLLRQHSDLASLSATATFASEQARLNIATASNMPVSAATAARISSQNADVKLSIQTTADLAPLILKARKRMKMNQQQFADAAGVGRRFLSELENGKPSLEFDKVIACALAAGIDIFAKPRKPY